MPRKTVNRTVNKFSRFANMLKDNRVGQGITQMELAEAVGYTSPQFISNAERGLCALPPDTLATVSKLIKVPKKELADAILEGHNADFYERAGIK